LPRYNQIEYYLLLYYNYFDYLDLGVFDHGIDTQLWDYLEELKKSHYTGDVDWAKYEYILLPKVQVQIKSQSHYNQLNSSSTRNT